MRARRIEQGFEHPTTLSALSKLALLLAKVGKHREAEPMMRRLLESLDGALGADHAHSITAMNNLAVLLKKMGKLEERPSSSTAGRLTPASGAWGPRTGPR
ncbi:unnamed protein product [Prorocentrum cordatum]|uniref:Kinesin light chain n=1 Tax=Prorocentrum cordatum TaxID=2364126 RepID=A0ABN9RUQ0_9DINO|nr:unnamed protein product [Polarella glacialis]